MSFILNPCLLSLLIVWYSASYLVCLTSTLFPLLSTFLGRHFLLLNIHYALLMQQFQFLTFLHLFGSNLIYGVHVYPRARQGHAFYTFEDRKSTRLNSSHVAISYAVFCLRKNIWTDFMNQHHRPIS